jgi:hypothetical protein
MRATICTTCKREIGVQPEYNMSIHSTSSSPGFRLAPHGMTRGGDKCPNSRMPVDEEKIYRIANREE